MRQTWKERVGLTCLLVTCLTFSIGFAIYFFPLYAWDIKYLNIEEATGLDKSILLQEYHQLLRYLTFPWISRLNLAHFPMSDNGRSHFVDVKYLFMLNNTLFIILLTPSIVYIKYLWKNQQLWKIIRPFRWFALLPIALGFLLLLGFDTFFTQFHQLLFSNDNWLFDWRTDPIILALPEEFFMHCFILAFVVLEILAISGIFIGKYQLKQSLHQNIKNPTMKE